MSEDTEDNSRRLHFDLLLLISFALFYLGFIVDRMVRWSDHFHGLVNDVFSASYIVFFGFTWCVYLLPWSLVIFALYWWRKWKRFRTQWVLAPAVLVLLVMIGNLLFQPQMPSKRFKNFTKTELPTNARNLHYHYGGIGISYTGDTYYFETTLDEVDRIIAELRLSEVELYGRWGLIDPLVLPLPNCPDVSTWDGAKQYKGRHDKQRWFYYLITDASRTKVYMKVGCK